MKEYLFNTLVVEAAGFIVGLRTESPIVTGGRILSVIKYPTLIFCCPVLSESDLYSI